MNEFDRCPTDGDFGLLLLLIQRGRNVEARLDAALAGACSLTFVQWRALDTMKSAGEPITLTALAERLQCVKSNATQLVDRLEADGAVRRVPDPRDRRSTLVALTERGAAAHREGRATLDAATESLLAELAAPEREALRALLDRLPGGRGK